MARLEDVPDEDTPSPIVYASAKELLAACRPLVDTLQLPSELLANFMDDDKQAMAIYHAHALRILRETQALLSRHSHLLERLQMDDDWSALLMDIVRLKGDDAWTSRSLRSSTQSLLSLFTASQKATASTMILSGPVRALFSPSPHPLLSSSSRALPREAGGPQAMLDFHESSSQAFKGPPGWGIHNVLCFASGHVDDVEREIGRVLPPTLVLMDDWEPAWRARGVQVLESWRTRVEPSVLKRMGVDRLLLKSMLHSLSLHSSTPLIPTVLQPALSLIQASTPDHSVQRAELHAQLVDKALLSGWMYAPSGLEGRPALMAISDGVQVLCAELGQGIIRWLKSIIPALLDPLRYPPTPSVLAHMQSNVAALLAVLDTIRGTGRVARWRGQILDAVARLWAGLLEREKEGERAWGQNSDNVHKLKADLVRIVAELAAECPSIRQEELPKLVELDRTTYQSLIPA